MNNCLQCDSQTTNPKFCSKSCSAKYNNKGVRRHGADTNPCPICNKPTRRKYCSIPCGAESKRLSKEHLNKSNAIRQSRYRAKKYKVLAPDANLEKINEIYRNCPIGYEVDHKVPLSRGGKHHEDNLQYLTVTENRSKGNRWWAQ